jgi:hypothetical protein
MASAISPRSPTAPAGWKTGMPMLWTYGVETGRLTMNEFVAVTSTNIAKILNMYPKKGAVLVGADADLVVWDPKKEKTITAGTQQSAIDYNVFEGKQVKGLPRFTLTRGHVAVDDGEIKTQEGHGKFVKPAPFTAGEQGAVDLEGTHRAAQGGTHGHSGERVTALCGGEGEEWVSTYLVKPGDDEDNDLHFVMQGHDFEFTVSRCQ